jgi:hypothetical protein
LEKIKRGIIALADGDIANAFTQKGNGFAVGFGRRADDRKGLTAPRERRADRLGITTPPNHGCVLASQCDPCAVGGNVATGRLAKTYGADKLQSDS